MRHASLDNRHTASLPRRTGSLLAMAFAVVMMALVAGGCSSGSNSRADNSEPEKPKVEPKPAVGMTKAEIKTMYGGDPNSTSTLSDGTEVWTFIPNYGERFIPFNYGYRPNYHRIHFDANGVVTKFEITE